MVTTELMISEAATLAAAVVETPAETAAVPVVGETKDSAAKEEVSYYPRISIKADPRPPTQGTSRLPEDYRPDSPLSCTRSVERRTEPPPLPRRTRRS
jgi:hypothetical protein